MNVLQKISITIAAIVILVALIPASPFQNFISSIKSGLPIGYINWFFPVGFCVNALGVWCTAIAAYYLITWILRQLDIIG